MDRIITISLKISCQETADAIWEAHKENGVFLGCKVLTIAEGSLDQIIEEALND